jgi:hypothetical protein
VPFLKARPGFAFSDDNSAVAADVITSFSAACGGGTNLNPAPLHDGQQKPVIARQALAVISGPLAIIGARHL